MTKTPLFELIIPCFNEAASLSLLIEKTIRAAQSVELTPDEFQLVLVNNGSSDASLEVLSGFQSGSFRHWLRVLNLEENQGYGGGLSAGITSSTAAWIGYSHADLQYDPRDVFRAFREGQTVGGPVLVRGIRSQRNRKDWIVSRLYELAVGVLWGFWCFDINGQPKLFSGELKKYLQRSPRGISFDAYVLLQAKKHQFVFRSIPVDLNARLHGQSHWSRGWKKKLTTYWLVLKELRKTPVRAH